MFESLVATILNRFLGAYIENFDAKQLNIGIWSGDVNLKNLVLKKESLDKFKLPLDVKYGHLGQLTLQIPWSNLKGKPVKVTIEDVYLLASPIILDNFDLEEDQQREQALKQAKLKDLEAIHAALDSNLSGSNDLAGIESFGESLITKIVDNLQITIKNIHIRYEDGSVLTESPYAIGATLSELSASSTDENWIPSFISITQALTRKLLLLKGFALYMNTESSSIYTDDHQELLVALKSCFAQSPPSAQFILKPVSGEGHLAIHKLGATNTIPHVRAELFFEEFGIDFDSSQYRDILWTASRYHWYQKTWKFRKLRPKVSIKEAPKDWLKYAARSILNEIHEKNYKWSWDHFKKRRDQRIEYIELWKCKQLDILLTPSQEEDFSILEEELSYEDIKFYRSLTRNIIKRDNLQRPKPSNSAQDSGKGWFSWWSGGQNNNGNATSSDDQSGSLIPSLTDEQRKALYETIDFDENNVESDINIPRDRVTMEIFVNLKKAGLSLKSVKHGPNLAEMAAEGCTAVFYKRPTSFLTNFQLQEFRIEDGTKKSLYKHIVSVKQLHSHTDFPSSAQEREEPFFQFSFENNPLDGSADSSLIAKLKSITIFYNCHFNEEIVRFFKPPKIHLDTVGAIMNAAEATMEGLSMQTRMGLQYSLEEHKTINLKLDLQAPLIIIPLDPTNWKSPVAILDAGHISVTSDLVEKSVISEFKSKESYSTQDWKTLNSLMYDKFNLHLQDTQFLVGPNIKSTMEQLHTQVADLSAVILDNLDLKLSLGISILPDAVSLPQFKIFGEIPHIQIAMNDFQYKTIMQLVDVLIPTTDSLDSLDGDFFETYGSDIQQIRDVEGLEPSSPQKMTFLLESSSQRMFEMDFKLNSVFLSLSRCVDPTTLKAEHLIDITGDSLSLFFYKTLADMHLDLSLKDIDVIDHIEKSGIPEFEKLISSNNFLEEDNVERRNSELFKVTYERNQRIAEFEGQRIEVFDQDVLLQMSALKMVISRKSILSLLNFVLNTFTDPEAEVTAADNLKHNDSSDDKTSPQKINVTVNLDSIFIVLNEDGIKLATLQLSTALIFVFLLPEAMEVNMKLGALTLHDDSNEGSARDSIFRSLISIEGDNLAELTYKTFDAQTNAEAYQSAFEFSTAATRINFVEDAFGKIFSYLSKFQKMKAIYDSAREAAINQANQIDIPNRMKTDILIRAPKVYFPKLIDSNIENCDLLVAELGELYLCNKFEEKNGVIHNLMKSGIRKVNLASTFSFGTEIRQVAKILEDLDVNFDIDYVEDLIPDVPTFTITGAMPEVDMHLTEHQLRYMYNLQNSITLVFSGADQDSLEDIEEDAEYANAVMKYRHRSKSEPFSLKRQSVSHDDDESLVEIFPNHKLVVFGFTIPKIGLTLYNRTEALETFESRKLASWAIHSLLTTFELRDDLHFEASTSVMSFTIMDMREGTENKFREIIPSNHSNDQQFVLNVSTSGEGDSRTTVCILNIEEPKTVLALDFLFELQAFSDRGFSLDSEASKTTQELDNDAESSPDEVPNHERVVEAPQPASPSTVGWSVNIIKPSIILLADSTVVNTESLVFKLDQILITSQNIVSLAVNNLGLFLVRMDNYDDQRMRIIDNFSISFALDSRGSTPSSFLTSIHLTIDPLVVRVSFRDIRLAMKIFERANEYYEKSRDISENDTNVSMHTISKDFSRKLSKYAPSTVSSFVSLKTRRLQELNENPIVVKGEEFEASFGGARFILIGDVYELPVLEMGVKPFEAKILNWSTDAKAEIHLESYIKIYNYAKSTWEPLLQDWPISVLAHKTLIPKPNILIEIASREIAQLTLSSRSIALLSQISAVISGDLPPKEREETTPYVIKNETGYDIEVWIDNQTDREKSKIIPNNGEINWMFEDWRTIRENLDTQNDLDVLAIKLKGSSYREVLGISVSGEGEDVFMLYPPVNGVHNRLVCEVTLRSDNIKVVYLRSTVTVRNNSASGIALRSARSEQVFLVPSGERRSLPIDLVYSESFMVKPEMETEFNWSKETLEWKKLMDNGASLCCSSIGQLSFYYFQGEAHYDIDEPLTSIYPHINIVLSAPIEIDNLLPFDIDFRLYDKSTKRDWSGDIQKGSSKKIQVATLESLLLLSVEPKNCGFGRSEFAIINSKNQSLFKRENFTHVRSDNGQVVRLSIHYPTQESSRTSLKVVLYSPYVILNRTGQNLYICDSSRPSNQIAVGTGAEDNIPHLFSFEKDSDTSSRALAKTSDSEWTSAISFDAIGQMNGVSASITSRKSEFNFGVSVSTGIGKYNLTKVVSFAPRYIVRNLLNEPLLVAENGTANQFELQANQLLPLYGLRSHGLKTIILRFAQEGKSWSSPFSIDDVGQVYLKLLKPSGQILLKVNTIVENATIFIEIEDANNQWPFSVMNFTNADFHIYQSNPNVNQNNEVVKDDVDYRPIYYRVPAKSVMPYAYDYPNAVVKDVIIRSHGRERAVDFAEIGNLKPFRLPATADEDQLIVDLNIVADGPTQSLVISKYDPSKSLYKLQSSSQSTTQLKFEATETDDNYFTKVVTRFEGFGISIINTRCQELCYASFRGVELRYNESDLYQNLSLKLKWIQVDNQLFGGIFPIIIYPTVIPKSGKEMNNHPTFSASLCKVKDDSHGVIFIKYATVLLQELSVEMDEDFIFALLDFSKIPGASWNREVEDKLCDDSLEIPEPLKVGDSSDIYFEALHLQPTLTHLSFVRTERVNAEDRTTSQNTFMFFVNMLTMAIGNINDAPITLNALFIENIRVPIPVLLQSIQTHYGQSFFYQVHKILGSADFLGNPVGLFNNLSSGVLDIFYEPYQGLVINDRPQEIGIGLAKGGLSFLKKSVFGFSDSFAKVTGSISKGLTVATMDKKFQDRRRLNQRRNRPKHALYGFTTGANSFVESISSGFTGIALAPLEGAAKEGAGGFFKGLGKGFIGLPTKTAIGFFDLASNVSEGIRNTTTVFDTDGLEKVRLPRHISYDQVVRPYSQREAQGQFWLKSIDGGAFIDETYLAHLVLSGEEKAVIVTFRSIILLEINVMKISWIITFESVKSISLETTGISIILFKKKGPFIPIAEKNSRDFLYQKIKIAVNKYNLKCQVML